MGILTAALMLAILIAPTMILFFSRSIARVPKVYLDAVDALMLSGNAVTLPGSVLDSARTLTAHIALIIAADFDSVEFKTIFICGITLYVMTSLGILLARHWDRGT